MVRGVSPRMDARSLSTNTPRASARSAASTCTAISRSNPGARSNAADLEAACNRRWLELMKGQPLLPGIAACVSSAKARGMKLAVASSSTQKWVTYNLQRFAAARSLRRDLHERLRRRCEARSCLVSARAREARREMRTRRSRSKTRRTAFSRPSGRASSASRFPIR